MATEQIELGDKAQDKITGFVGIVMGHTKWIHGCDRFTLQPLGLDKDGKPIEMRTFDEAQLSIVEKHAYVGDRPPATFGAAPKPGGPADNPERRADVNIAQDI